MTLLRELERLEDELGELEHRALLSCRSTNTLRYVAAAKRALEHARDEERIHHADAGGFRRRTA